MDDKFIKSIVLAYANKHDIKGDKNKLAEYFSEDIRGHLHALREEDIYAYNSIYDQSKGYQGEVIEIYLNKVVFESVDAAIGGAIEGGGSVIGGLGKGLMDLAGGVASGVGSMVDGVGKIFSSGAFTLDTITKHFLGITLLILLLVKTSLGRMLSKNIFKAASSIGGGFETVGSFLTKRGRYFKFRYSIIQKNAVQCYKTAGVTPDDVNLLHYLSVGDTRLGLSEKSLSEAQALQKCFINYSIESISLLMKSYFLCLKNTGGFETVEKLSANDIIKVTSGVELSAMCQEYYTIVKESFDNFYHLLDFVYDDKEDRKKTEIMNLKDRIIQERAFVRTVQNVNKFGSFPKRPQQPFQKPVPNFKKQQIPFQKENDE